MGTEFVPICSQTPGVSVGVTLELMVAEDTDQDAATVVFTVVPTVDGFCEMVDEVVHG
jgi:hypothetical protein